MTRRLQLNTGQEFLLGLVTTGVLVWVFCTYLGKTLRPTRTPEDLLFIALYSAVAGCILLMSRKKTFKRWILAILCFVPFAASIIWSISLRL